MQFTLDLTKAETAVFNAGQTHGWNCAKSGQAKVNPHEELSFLYELFEDGFKLGHASFIQSKQITP